MESSELPPPLEKQEVHQDEITAFISRVSSLIPENATVINGLRTAKYTLGATTIELYSPDPKLPVGERDNVSNQTKIEIETTTGHTPEGNSVIDYSSLQIVGEGTEYGSRKYDESIRIRNKEGSLIQNERPSDYAINRITAGTTDDKRLVPYEQEFNGDPHIIPPDEMNILLTTLEHLSPKDLAK